MAEIRKDFDARRGKPRRHWQAIYRDAAGARVFRSTHVSNKRLAQAIADRWEREAHAPRDAATDPTTIDEAVETMLDEIRELIVAGKRSAGTLHCYTVKTGHLKRIFADGEGDDAVPWDISRISSGEPVDMLISKRRAEGASENTIAKELVALSRTLRLMKRRGRWPFDLDAVLPYRFSPEYVPRKRFLRDMDELVLLLGHMTPDHAARAAFEVATSANLGETFHALRADIVERSVLVRGTKRMSRWREVPVVTDWQRQLLAMTLEHARGRDGKLFLFDAGYDTALEVACTDAGLPHTTSNDLRRTFCHWMKDAGVLRELVAAAMGHKGTKMVDQVYGKPTTEELERQMLRSIGGTPAAQTHAHPVDDTDDPSGRGARKSRKVVPRAGVEPARGKTPGDFKSPAKLVATPRAYKQNRDYESARGTPAAQHEPPVVAFHGRRA